MLVLDFTIHYIQSGSGCNDENTNLAKNSPEQHIGKNYNKMQETLLVKCQVFRKMANLVIFNEKSGKTLPMALWILLRDSEFFIWRSLAIEFQLIR